MTSRLKKRVVRPVSFNPIAACKTIEEAEQLSKSSSPDEFYLSILSEDELMGLAIPDKQFFLQGLIMENSITLINGPRGSGKSWLVLAIANAIVTGQDFGPWKIRRSVNTMLIDGEMPIGSIQTNLRRFHVNRRRSALKTLFIYPDSYAYRLGLHRANLLDKQWRDDIFSNVHHLGVEMIILDNLASLAPGIDENAKIDFDEINRWLLELRYSGVSTIMTHHTGKDHQQRGTSAHEDHVDLSLLLRPFRIGDGCNFNVSAIKDRNFIMKRDKHALTLIDTENGGVDFSWIKKDVKIQEALDAFANNPSLSEQEAFKLGIKRTTYFEAKKEFSDLQGG